MTASKPEKETVKKSQNDFFGDVYQVVKLIPKGRATSYGAIAAYLGSKRGARLVGWAMGASFTIPDIPAHRVVNKAGLLSAKLQFGAPDTMQKLLESEGIIVRDDTIQNWETVFWDPEKELS